MSDRNYQPSEDIVVVLILALRLKHEQVEELLCCAEYSLFHSNKWDIVVGYFIKCQAGLPAGLFYGIVYKDSSVIKWKRKISVSLTLICVSSLFVKYTVSDFINYEARGFNQPAWHRFLWRNSWRSMAKAREGLPDG